MPTPPRFPRALFIAAFAVAGAVFATPTKPPIARMTECRRDRRDRSIAHIARWLGSSIIAGGRAQAAFERRAALIAGNDKRPESVDPIAAAIIASADVTTAIGKPVVIEPGEACEIEAPWVELHDGAAVPHVRLYWRGEFIQGEAMPRVWRQDERGKMRIERGQGETVGSSRTLDMERFSIAVEAAKRALRQAGFAPSSFTEVKRVNTPAFKGAVATIGLVRARPVWAAPIRTRAAVR